MVNGALSRATPAFLIDAHPERQLPRQRLRLARDFGDLIRSHDVAREENDPPRSNSRASDRRSEGIESPANPAIASWPT